ncbi:uncharacterized protein LOC124358560 [Homalodisca vitripennis]|uniref:uncharacterized protein LOC124358560 n=1 Tax=Homalodisca vitripennis TaxID=197043 RepID=UPI001EEB3469|nr:uncharacterized protein LOC124358560 [Homalodisca vitripennis]
MVREVESGDYLSTDHMDRFGSILDENTEYHPVSCLAIDAMEGVSAVATPHIQILFSGKIDASSIGHWIVVFHDGSNLYVYDSLNSAHLTADQTKLLSLLFPDLSIVPAFIPVQRQENGFDCGVFAIANATSLALGRDPAKLRYDIPSMRPHLAEMLRTGRLDMFPTLSVSSPPEPIIKDPNSTCLSIVESLPPLEISTMSVCAPVKKGPGMLFIVTLSSTLKSTEMLFNVTLSSTLRSTEMLSSVTLSSTLRSTEMLFSVTLSNILRSIEMLFSATLSSILKFTGVLFSVIQKNILTQIYKKLFDEEKDRKKWCCGEGSYKVHNLPPLDASFYSNRLFIERARAYNDLFAFCALEVTGGYRHPSGLAFFKIEGKMYHQVHSLDAPGQKFRTKGGDVQFVNRCRLYIDDGEERKKHCHGLSDEPSVNAHLEFEVTSRSTHGPVLGDRQTGIEVHAVLSNEDTITDPRKLTIWKKSDRRPSSVDLFSPLMEPFQYPLLYPQGPLDELLEAQRGRQAGGQVLGDITRDETVLGEGGVQAGKVYLPSSFTGGPRYMKVHYENAMGLVSRLGSPTFFLTFTFSATWEENKKACPHNSGRSDPSTACRIFQIKLGELLRDLRSGAMFSRPARDIDSVIRADIPSEEEAAGRLRKLVLKHMIHGPCGTDHRTDFLCWDSAKGHCNKFYPKPACQTTHVDERGFVQYKRDYTNEGFITSRRRQIKVHDGWVVPYNSALLLKYEAHINLELASTRRVIKYLFKYLMKGGSLQNVTVTPLGKQEDEVEHYVTKRMVGASDACWRLLDFPVSKLEPTVECLPVHLEGKQSVVFRPRQLSDAVTQASSKLMVYFNRPHHETFDNVTYQTFYEKFMVHTKRPRTAELYEHPDGHHFVTTRQRSEKVCRLMWVSPNRGEQYYLRILLMSTPCRGYVDLLARGGPGCRTFQDVARNLGLVEDEEEYNHALREASTFMTGRRLRSFFVILCNMGAPAALLWESFKNHLSEDHLERNPLDPELADDTTELGRELLNYGENLQRTIVEDWVPKLSPDQRRVFEYVRSLLLNPRDRRTSRIIFLDGPGGYGKTSLIRVILAYVRGCRQVALAVASSGIAARNMAGGTTAHSMFRLPLDLGHGTGVWNITNGSQRAELIRAAQLIVFDEAPMAHRYIFEMIDRSLRDLMNSSVPFGNKIFICSGDFRQIAPVVEKARTPADVACVSLRASHLWRLFTLFSLTTPQRTSGSIDYSNFLLGVGNGTINPLLFGEGRERESLIPLTGEINGRILDLMDGRIHELRSADTVDREDDDGLDVDVNLLNQATGKGVPDHVLRLKVGSVCLIMRNLNIGDGLVNGTKVIVTAISSRLITVRLIGNTFAFAEGSPLRFCRRQFPLMLAYCMTGHKSQGQTIEYVGVDLRTDCFTHGQLYVLLSRVRRPDDIVVLVPDDRIVEGVAYAKNIVYDELLLKH